MRKLLHSSTGESWRAGLVGPGRVGEVYDGTDGNDTHTGTDGDDTLNGNGGNDTLSGGRGNDTIDGGTGDDILSGDEGDDTLLGGIGNDVITSTSGADSVDGGGGYDRWIGSYVNAVDSLIFDQRTQTLSNGTTLTGIEQISLTAGYGDDRFAMNGDQAFTVDGGSGYDTFAFDPSGGSRVNAKLKITVTIASGSFAVTMQDGRIYNHANGMESVEIVGSGKNDKFVLKGFEFDDNQTLAVDGGAGRDTLVWDLSKASSTTFVVGGDGTVTSNLATLSHLEQFDLELGSGTNVVRLGDGHDSIRTAGTNDTVSGGGGDDLIYTYGHGATIDGGEGYDVWSTTLLGSVTYDQATQTFSDGTTLTGIERVAIISSTVGNGDTFNITQASNLAIETVNDKDVVAIDLSGLASGITITADNDEDYNRWHLSFGGTVITTAYEEYQPHVTLKATDFDDVVTVTDDVSRYLLPSIDGGAGFDTLNIKLEVGSRFVLQDDGTVTSFDGHYAGFEEFHISASIGENVIALGAGDDTISVLASSTDDNDLSGGGGADQITAAKGDDRLEGGDGDDVLKGGDGDDVLSGGAGTDILDGGSGNDTAGYYSATAGVTVEIKSGLQNTGGAGMDLLSSIENLSGSAFDDMLTGDGFANVLRGRDGDDVLSGGDGNDRLEGGPGTDRLYGGTGADVFAFIKLTDFGTERDRILDFSHADGDKVDLSVIDPSKAPGDQEFTFIGTSAFTKSPDLFELRIQDQHNGTFLVQGDVNHDGKADFLFAVLAGVTPLVADDFVL